MKEIGVLSVTYNRIQLLQEEIDSIRKQTYKNFDIIVVNNCSTDGTKEWLEQQLDIHSIHVEPENIGPARAFAVGMKYIAEQGYKYCWLMDDDVECRSDALEQLYNAYHEKDNIGFVCSKVIGVQGEPMNVPEIDSRPVSNGYSNYIELLDQGMLKVINCTFVSMFLSCETMFSLGLPLGEFYNWAVDTEYTRRLSQHNPCYYVNNSVVVHKRLIQGPLSFKSETNPLRLSYYMKFYRNLLYVKWKYNSKGIKGRTQILLSYLADMADSLFSFQFKLFVIQLHAIINFIVLKPEIEYPVK